MSADPTSPGRRGGRHQADPISLVFGVLFAGAAVLYGLVDPSGDSDTGHWYLPVLLIAVGVLGLVVSLARRGGGEDPQS